MALSEILLNKEQADSVLTICDSRGNSEKGCLTSYLEQVYFKLDDLIYYYLYFFTI